MASPVFYEDGLLFSCSRCSACCRGGPGYVFLAKSDLRALMSYLRLDLRSLFKEYCRLVDTGTGLTLSLCEKPRFDCVFWADGDCEVYPARPVQCLTYPFWASILDGCESWVDEARHCPGVGIGERRSKEYIEDCLFARRQAGTIVLPFGTDLESLDEDKVLGS